MMNLIDLEKVLKNATLIAKIGVDTAENEPSKVRNFHCHCPGPGRETLEGSFSSVSTPNFTSEYSFFSIFRDLSDSHSFAPLQIQNLQIFSIFRQKIANFRDFANFCRIFAIFLRKFHRILSEFREIAPIECPIPRGIGNSEDRGIGNSKSNAGNWELAKLQI